MERVISASRKPHSRTYDSLRTKRNKTKKYEKESEIKGTFFLKTIVSLTIVAFVMAISASDSEATVVIKEKLKGIISQNVSFESVKNSIARITDSLSKTETVFHDIEDDYKINQSSTVESENNTETRIDEDILNKMNKESDIYYINQQKN